MWWPFKRTVPSRLSSQADYVEAIRALSRKSASTAKGQLGALIQAGGAMRVLSGEAQAQRSDEPYLEVIDRLAANPDRAVPAMCHPHAGRIGLGGTGERLS